MKRKTDSSKALAAVNAAARQCGLSYGVYVSKTGGQVPPPPELVVLGSGKRCRYCYRVFTPAAEHQEFCCAYCRKADYDRRKRENKAMEH